MKFTIKDVLRIILALSCIGSTQIGATGLPSREIRHTNRETQRSFRRLNAQRDHEHKVFIQKMKCIALTTVGTTAVLLANEATIQDCKIVGALSMCSLGFSVGVTELFPSRFKQLEQSTALPILCGLSMGALLAKRITE